MRFGEVAGLYDRVRPGYPPALVDDVIATVPGAHDVVEIGCGTGKATELFVRRGMAVIGVEPDAAMAAVARRKLAAYPETSICIARFEEWDAARGSCDIVAAAQSWHWLDADVALSKVRRILRRPGGLALFANTPRPGDTELRPALDAVYQRHAPDIAWTSVMTWWSGGPAQADEWNARIEASGFLPPGSRRYDWACRYSTEEFITLLQTHSDHRGLEPPCRDALLAGIASVIDGNGGSLTFAYRTVLTLARPRD